MQYRRYYDAEFRNNNYSYFFSVGYLLLVICLLLVIGC